MDNKYVLLFLGVLVLLGLDLLIEGHLPPIEIIISGGTIALVIGGVIEG